MFENKQFGNDFTSIIYFGLFSTAGISLLKKAILISTFLIVTIILFLVYTQLILFLYVRVLCLNIIVINNKETVSIKNNFLQIEYPSFVLYFILKFFSVEFNHQFSEYFSFPMGSYNFFDWFNNTKKFDNQPLIF